MSGVRVAGVGLTPFGDHGDRSGRDLFAEAAEAAIADAGVTHADVERLAYGNFMGELAEQQGHQAPLMAEAAGVSCPATRYEAACASAGVAVKAGVEAIRAGSADVVLAGGMERMNCLDTGAVTEALAIAADEQYEVRAGMTFPSAYALMARAYFERFGGSREALAHIAVKNHANALTNEYAQYQREISVAEALNSPMVASPLGLYDACPITDGASAVVLVSESYAESTDCVAPVAITGIGQGGDHLALQDRTQIAETPAATAAAERAYAEASIEPDEIDLAEVHDCFTIAEALALESLGIADTGDGITAARDGRTQPTGSCPVNLSGGLKAKGHPVGATGGSQIAEMTRLLRGDHPNSSRVEPATTGVTHNAGGTVASAVVHVLEVVE